MKVFINRSKFWKKGKFFLFSFLVISMLFFLLEGLLIFLKVGDSHKVEEFNATIPSALPGFIKDPILGFRLKPNEIYALTYKNGIVVKTYRLNSLGFRDDELNHKATYKILCLGDSTTYGIGVSQTEKTFPYILEQIFKQYLLIRKSNESIDVFNAGVPSYSIYQGFHTYLNYLLNLAHWDYIVISFGWNHGLLKGNWKHVSNNLESRKGFLRVRNLLKRLKTYNLLSQVFQNFVKGEITDYESYETIYEEIVKVAKEQNSKVVIWPLIIQGEGTKTTEKLNGISRKVANRNGSFFVDLNPQFKKFGKEINWVDPIHFGPKGHSVLAEELFHTIKKDIFR